MNGLLIQGISVMCIGMGTVVAFLCITIVSMFIMSAAVKKLNQLFPEAVPAVYQRNRTASESGRVRFPR